MRPSIGGRHRASLIFKPDGLLHGPASEMLRTGLEFWDSQDMQRALTETEKKWDSNVKEFSAKQTESAKRFIAEVWAAIREIFQKLWPFPRDAQPMTKDEEVDFDRSGQSAWARQAEASSGPGDITTTVTKVLSTFSIVPCILGALRFTSCSSAGPVAWPGW